MPFRYPFPRPAVTCDVVAFTMQSDDLAVLLVRRKKAPFRGAWALPGGFVDENEPLERAASRELVEETGVTGARLEQLGAFGDPGRDPCGHTITVAWMTFLLVEVSLQPGDDATEARFVPLRSLDLSNVPPLRAKAPRASVTRSLRSSTRRPSRAGDASILPLAFDHGVLVQRAYERLRRHLDHPLEDPSFAFLPPRFTLLELKRTYEVCLDRAFTMSTIRKNLVDRGLVVPAAPRQATKPAMQLYRWNRS